MVTRTGFDGQDGRDRGQLVLIGAITIAFILLGVVVVFNGVLYTQTLSSSASGQTLSEADRVELEIEDAVCVADAHGNVTRDLDGDFIEEYLNSSTASSSSVTTIDEDIEVDGDSVTVDVTYTSSDLEYDRTIVIDTGEKCANE